MSAQANRIVFIDFLRFVGAILVVTLHASPLREIAPSANIIVTEGIARIAVPFFFIASGYFLSEAIAKGRFKIWALKIIKLYILWMIIYSFFWVGDLVGQPFLALRMIKIIFMGYYHLWYLASLFLAACLLFYVVRLNRDDFVPLLALVGLLLGFLFQYYYLYGPNGATLVLIKMGNLNRSFFTFAFPYVCIGYLIASRSFLRDCLRKNATRAVVVGASIFVLEVVGNLKFANIHDFSDNLVSISILAPTVFVVSLNSSMKFGFVARFLGELSLAIYLVHIGVLKFLDSLAVFDPLELWALTCIVSTIIGSILIHPNLRFRWLVS